MHPKLARIGWACFALAAWAPCVSPCPCYEKSCMHSEIQSQKRITCYLPGRNFKAPSIVNTNTDSCTLDDMFSRNEMNAEGDSTSCPALDLENVELDVYLEPCEETYKKIQKLDIKKIIETIRTPALASNMWGALENCTARVHEVQKSMFTGSSTVDYTGGITISSASVWAKASNMKDGPPKATITRENIQEDATCNIAVVSMPDTSLLHLNLDNTRCLQRVFSNSTKTDDFKNALEDFGPDQLGLIRVTSYFEGFLPTDFVLSYLNLATWKPYRTEYPGRALISVDSLRNKKFPPDPIDIGTKARFDAIFDEHNVPVIVPFSGATDVVDGNFVCNTTEPEKYCSPKPNVVGKPDLTCAAIATVNNAKICNKSNLIPVIVQCPSSLYVGQPVVVSNVAVPKCIDRRDVRTSEICPDGETFDVRYQSCTTVKSNRINSRPIDIVLWDFQGSVFFGNNFDSSNGRIITVLVYGDIETTNVGVLKGSGEVFEDYFDSATKAAFRLPDPGLCLLDGRDFVSLPFLCAPAPADPFSAVRRCPGRIWLLRPRAAHVQSRGAFAGSLDCRFCHGCRTGSLPPLRDAKTTKNRLQDSWRQRLVIFNVML